MRLHLSRHKETNRTAAFRTHETYFLLLTLYFRILFKFIFFPWYIFIHIRVYLPSPFSNLQNRNYEIAIKSTHISFTQLLLWSNIDMVLTSLYIHCLRQNTGSSFCSFVFFFFPIEPTDLVITYTELEAMDSRYPQYALTSYFNSPRRCWREQGWQGEQEFSTFHTQLFLLFNSKLLLSLLPLPASDNQYFVFRSRLVLGVLFSCWGSPPHTHTYKKGHVMLFCVWLISLTQ